MIFAPISHWTLFFCIVQYSGGFLLRSVVFGEYGVVVEFGGGEVCDRFSCNAPINVMPEGGGGPRDRVGTLIRNENLESNFLTLGIRFQFKVPHLGEGFEFNISHETENFKPSDHEVKNRCLHLRLSGIVLLQ